MSIAVQPGQIRGGGFRGPRYRRNFSEPTFFCPAARLLVSGLCRLPSGGSWDALTLGNVQENSPVVMTHSLLKSRV